MNDTPTPRTDKRKASFALDTIRQLERELTVAREELNTAREDQAYLHKDFSIAIEELKETKKHLKDANRGAEINAHALRINADKLIAVTEQRDRLAEAIRKHKFCDFELWEALQSLNQPTEL